MKESNKKKRKYKRKTYKIKDGLVGFYGLSTLFGYLMLNPVHSYILNI